MPKTEVGGLEIYYETRGEGSSLALINGWGDSMDCWSPRMIGALAERHMVVTMDNRGTGRSSKPDVPYTMETMATDAVGVLDAVGVERSHVMGFSMGGMVAQAVALDHPERVSSLVLCGTSPSGPHRVAPSVQVLIELALIANPSSERTERDRAVKLLRLLYPRGYVDTNLEELIHDETYVDHPTPDYALYRQNQAIVGFDSYDRLPYLRMPVLVMTGEDDVLVPPHNSKVITRRIPGAELVKIRGAGHGFLRQRTDMAVPIILGFLKRVDGG